MPWQAPKSKSCWQSVALTVGQHACENIIDDVQQGPVCPVYLAETWSLWFPLSMFWEWLPWMRWHSKFSWPSRRKRGLVLNEIEPWRNPLRSWATCIANRDTVVWFRFVRTKFDTTKNCTAANRHNSIKCYQQNKPTTCQESGKCNATAVHSLVHFQYIELDCWSLLKTTLPEPFWNNSNYFGFGSLTAKLPANYLLISSMSKTGN